MTWLKVGSLAWILCAAACVAPAAAPGDEPGDEAEPGRITGKPVPVRPPMMAGATTGDALPAKPDAAMEAAAISPRNFFWQTTVTSSATSAWPTQFITVTTTANTDVGPTPFYIRIYENTSPPNILATCSTGTTCSASITKPTIADAVVIGTIVDAAGTSQLGEPPDVILNWHGASPAISVSPTTVAVGATATVTATTSADVGPSPFYIEIFDMTTGTLIQSCGGGTSCVASVSQSAAGAHSYRAFISPFSTTVPPPGSIESTNPVLVAWSNVGFAITLDDPRTTPFAIPITISATTNHDVGPTPYFLEIYDVTTGVRLASCGSGLTCSVQFEPPGCGPNPDRVVAVIASSSASFPPPNIQAASVVDWACTRPLG
jgi:hypothetical protein